MRDKSRGFPNIFAAGKRRTKRAKRAYRAVALFCMFIAATVPLVQLIYQPKAEAAALTIASYASEAAETTTSLTYATTSGAGGASTIAAASLPAGTYLVAWGAAVANSLGTDLTNARLVRGSTEIAQLGSESNAAAAADNGRTATGYWLGTLNGSEALTIQYSVSNASSTGYIDSRFIKAVRLDTHLLENTDYFSSGTTETASLSITNAAISVWSTIVSMTKTFHASAAQDYIVLASMEISPDNTTNDCMAQLKVDGTAVASQVQEGESGADVYGYVVADLRNIGSGSKTLSLEGQSVGTATCDFRRPRIYVLRASVFDQVLESESLTESAPTGTTAWASKVSQSYTPNQAEDVLVLFNWMGGSSATTAPLGTRINNTTDTALYADTMSHAVNNATVDYYTGMSAASLNFSTAKTFNGEFHRTTAGAGDPKIKEARLLVWSMTLKNPALEQAAYRWYNNTETTGANWYSGSWSTRRSILIDNSASTENLVDFPLRVSLSSANIDYAKTQNSGQDIRFTDSDGTTLLKHEIEEWNELGTSEVWVKVPQVNASSTTDNIYMYYGNASVADGQDAVNVWNSSYRGVWHMNKTTSVEPNVTSQNSDGTVNGTTRGVAGKISKAYDFPGVTGNNVTITDPVDGHLDFGTSSFSYGGWVYSDASTGGQQVFMGKGGGGATLSGYVYWIETNNYFESRLSDGTLAYNTYEHPAVFGAWRYIVVTVDRTSGVLHIYDNGSEILAGSNDSVSAAGSFDTTRNLVMGETQTGTNMLDGKLDEQRISTGVLSAEWIEADYLNQSNAMTSFSGEDSGQVSPLTGSDSTSMSIDSAAGVNFRLRVALHVSATTLRSTNATLKLQAAPRSGTCDTAFVGESGTYADISPSSGAIRYLDNAGKTDGQGLPPLTTPVHLGHDSVAQSYEEANNFTAVSPTLVGQDAVWEFALVNNSIGWNNSYCLRVVNSTGTTLSTYSVIPEVAVCYNPPLSAQMRHGKAHCSSVNKRLFYW